MGDSTRPDKRRAGGDKHKTILFGFTRSCRPVAHLLNILSNPFLAPAHLTPWRSMLTRFSTTRRFFCSGVNLLRCVTPWSSACASGGRERREGAEGGCGGRVVNTSPN